MPYLAVFRRPGDLNDDWRFFDEDPGLEDACIVYSEKGVETWKENFQYAGLKNWQKFY